MDNSILQMLMQALYGQNGQGSTPTAGAAPQAAKPASAMGGATQAARPAGAIAPGGGVNYTNQQPTTKLALGSKGGGAGAPGGSSGGGLSESC